MSFLMDAINYWEKFFSLSWWAIWTSDSGAWRQWANRRTIPGPLQPATGGGTATLLTFSRLWNIYFSSQVLDPSLQLILVKGQARAPTHSPACQQQDYQMIIFRSPHLTTTEQGQAREQEWGLFQLNQLVSCIGIPPAWPQGFQQPYIAWDQGVSCS